MILSPCKIKNISNPNLFTDDFFDGDSVNGCPRACDYMDISFGYPSIYDVTNTSASSLTLYFKTSIAVRKSHLTYPRSSLFAEIGGYTGLLLGVSLLDVTKVVQFFLDKIRTVGVHVDTQISKVDPAIEEA